MEKEEINPNPIKKKIKESITTESAIFLCVNPAPNNK